MSGHDDQYTGRPAGRPAGGFWVGELSGIESDGYKSGYGQRTMNYESAKLNCARRFLLFPVSILISSFDKFLSLRSPLPTSLVGARLCFVPCRRRRRLTAQSEAAPNNGSLTGYNLRRAVPRRAAPLHARPGDI